MNRFSSRIIAWQRQHGRHTLPWQNPRDPYRIWLSEIMLQQTQVATVVPYFERFVKRFPNLQTLARASENDVLTLWSGLGYYSRARNLHKAAQHIVLAHDGNFPRSHSILESLPGVGRSTAAAIAALAFGEKQAILDGNVRRVLARHAGIDGWPGDKTVERQLWKLAESRLPDANLGAYTQGMMDLGAGICTRARPDCARCPIAGDCVARIQARIARIPAPRPRKALPEKHVRMLIVIEGSEILLEKRPASGIWGGLWSFPELVPDIDALAHCRNARGFDIAESSSLADLSHGFTHFRLLISPLVVRIQPKSSRPQLEGQCWLAPARAIHTAVPAPVKKLLRQIDA